MKPFYWVEKNLLNVALDSAKPPLFQIERLVNEPWKTNFEITYLAVLCNDKIDLFSFRCYTEREKMYIT